MASLKSINEELSKFGYEVVKGNSYYYFSRLNDSSPIISYPHEEGLYGWNIKSSTKEQIVDELKYRLKMS